MSDGNDGAASAPLPVRFSMEFTKSPNKWSFRGLNYYRLNLIEVALMKTLSCSGFCPQKPFTVIQFENVINSVKAVNGPLG